MHYFLITTVQSFYSFCVSVSSSLSLSMTSISLMLLSSFCGSHILHGSFCLLEQDAVPANAETTRLRLILGEHCHCTCSLWQAPDDADWMQPLFHLSPPVDLLRLSYFNLLRAFQLDQISSHVTCPIISFYNPNLISLSFFHTIFINWREHSPHLTHRTWIIWLAN